MGVITFKDSEGLKEAIRRAAFASGHSNSSRIIIESIKANPEVAKELKNIPKKVKK